MRVNGFARSTVVIASLVAVALIAGCSNYRFSGPVVGGPSAVTYEDHTSEGSGGHYD